MQREGRVSGKTGGSVYRKGGHPGNGRTETGGAGAGRDGAGGRAGFRQRRKRTGQRLRDSGGFRPHCSRNCMSAPAGRRSSTQMHRPGNARVLPLPHGRDSERSGSRGFLGKRLVHRRHALQHQGTENRRPAAAGRRFAFIPDSRWPVPWLWPGCAAPGVPAGSR